MNRLFRTWALLAACHVLLSCSSALQWHSDYYVVEPGDTIYSIAFRYHIDQRDLLAWNQIENPALIRPGQTLRLTPPSGSARVPQPAQQPPPVATRPAPPPPRSVRGVQWRWPTDGRVLGAYGTSAQTQAGIQIGGTRGQPVRAASGGRVVYAGTGLAGYGHLIIIKHNDDFLSAYGNNDRLLVAEGDIVAVGQPIARMGIGPGQTPLLHFEIRLRGEPVNPAPYLPARR